MSDETLRLYTFAVSHFSEKIRWTLDASQIPYREIAWTPSLHLLRAKLKSGKKTTVPIVQLGSDIVQDSTNILHFLARTQPSFPLLPSEPALQNEVLALEDRFDHVGEHVVRYAYQTALDSPKAVQNAWLARANGFERSLVPAVFPVIVPVFRRMFRISAATAERAEGIIRENVDWLDARLSDGRRYLAGDRLTVADITAASLLAPLACPDEHPIYGTAEYRTSLAKAAEPFTDRPAFAWIRDTYRRERVTGAPPRN